MTVHLQNVDCREAVLFHPEFPVLNSWHYFKWIRKLAKKNGGDISVPVWIQKCRVVKSQMVDFLKIELGMEAFYQITLQIILLLMTDTKTATTSGLQTYFHKNTIFGLNTEIILGLSIAWSLRTSISLHVKKIKKQKVYFGFTQTFFVGFWALVSTMRRVLSIVCFFVPSLGLQDILYHWLAEQYTFSIKKQYTMVHRKDQVHLFNMTETLLWSELDRWNYYGDLNEPTAPSYSLYTGLSLKWTFVTFFMLLTFQFTTMALVKLATSEEFKGEGKMFNQSLHVLQNLNFAFPFVDWDEQMVSGEEFRQRYSNTELEMACSFAVNIGFSMVMLMPIWFTGNNCSA